MGIAYPHKQHIDGKKAFALWSELGSLKKVTLHFQKHGKHMSNGKPFTEMAVREAAIKWVLLHPDEAKPYYEDAGLDEAILGGVAWDMWLLNTAIGIYKNQRNTFLNWVAKMGFEQYEYHYADYYNLQDTFSELFVSDGSQELFDIAKENPKYFNFHDGKLYLKVYRRETIKKRRNIDP